MAWSPIATAHRGSLSAVEMTPYGRHWSVKGNLSRIGVDMVDRTRLDRSHIFILICSRRVGGLLLLLLYRRGVGLFD